MKVLLKRIAIGLVILIITVLVSCKSIESFYDFNSYKAKLRNTLASEYDLDINIKYDIKLKILPYPKMILSGVSVRYNDNIMLQIDEIALTNNLFDNVSSIFDEVLLQKGTINLNILTYYIQKHSHKVNNGSIIKIKGVNAIQNSEKSLRSIYINSLSLNYDPNSYIFLDTKIENDKKVSTINISISDMHNKNAVANFAYNSDNIRLRFSGKYLNSNNLDVFSGTLQTEVMLNTATNNTALLFDSDVLVNSKKKSLIVQNIRTNSDLIDEITGKFIADFSGTNVEVMGCIKVNKINLISLEPNSKTLDYLISKTMNLFDSYYESMNNVVSTLNVDISEIDFANGNLSDINLSVDILNNKGSLNNLQIKLPGGSYITARGVIYRNSIRPKFVGKVEFNSANFKKFISWIGHELTLHEQNNNAKFVSSINIIPHVIRFSDIDALVCNNKISGSFVISRGKKQALDFTSHLILEELNLDNTNMSDIIDTGIASMYLFDMDKTGEVFFKVTNNNLWLREKKNHIKFNLSAKNIIFKNQSFKDFGISILIKKNHFSIINMGMKDNEGNKINLSSELTLPTFRPLLKLNMFFEKFDYVKFINLLPDYSKIKMKYIELEIVIAKLI